MESFNDSEEHMCDDPRTEPDPEQDPEPNGTTHYFEHKHKFKPVIRQLSRCYMCQLGGCGWQTDYCPFWFCGPECIDEYEKLTYKKN